MSIFYRISLNTECMHGCVTGLDLRIKTLCTSISVSEHWLHGSVTSLDLRMVSMHFCFSSEQWLHRCVTCFDLRMVSLSTSVSKPEHWLYGCVAGLDFRTRIKQRNYYSHWDTSTYMTVNKNCPPLLVEYSPICSLHFALRWAFVKKLDLVGL